MDEKGLCVRGLCNSFYIHGPHRCARISCEKYLAALAATGSDKEPRNTSPAGHEAGRLNLMANAISTPRTQLERWCPQTVIHGKKGVKGTGESPSLKRKENHAGPTKFPTWPLCREYCHRGLGAPVSGPVYTPIAISIHFGNIFGRGHHVPCRRSDPSRNARLLSWIALAEDFTFQGVGDCIVLGCVLGILICQVT